MKKVNKEILRMQMLAGIITESQYKAKLNEAEDLSSPEAFQKFMNSIPNEKYFPIADEESDWFMDEERLPESFNWEAFDDEWDGDLVDYFYDPIFDNELKGKPGIEANDFSEFQDIDREKDNEEEGYFGRRTIMLVDKIRDIITAYKEKNSSSDKIPLTPRVKKYIDEVIQDAKNDGEIENLLNAGFFDTDLADNILTKFMDPFPNALDLSQEVENYIDSQL
jgi:hypothetical protein